MVAPGLILADLVAEQAKRAYRQQLLWAAVGIAGALLLMALILAWVKQWRKKPQPPPLSPSDQLAHFRTLYERGEMSAEEFARVRARLMERMRQDLAAEEPPLLQADDEPPGADGPANHPPPPDGPAAPPQTPSPPERS